MMMVMLTTNKDTPHQTKIKLIPIPHKLKPKLILLQGLRATIAKVAKETKSLIPPEVMVKDKVKDKAKDKVVITLLITKPLLPPIMVKADPLVMVMEMALDMAKEEPQVI
jgi:hypothetical protein